MAQRRRQCLELLVDALRIFSTEVDDDQDRKALARAAAALSKAVPVPVLRLMMRWSVGSTRRAPSRV